MMVNLIFVIVNSIRSTGRLRSTSRYVDSYTLLCINSHNYNIGSFPIMHLALSISVCPIPTHPFIHIINTDLSTCPPVDQLLLTKIRLTYTFTECDHASGI